MFTGLIQETGILKKITKAKDGYRLLVAGEKTSQSAKKGESVAINGTCLTVLSINGKDIEFDMMEETYRITSFKTLKSGDIVNIETAMNASAKFDGHFVNGHIDLCRVVKKIEKNKKAYIDVELKDSDKLFIVLKGSIALDGISLTIAEIFKDRFRAYLIPTTIEKTNLKTKKENDLINIEFDILAKYALHMHKRKKTEESRITEKYLADKGFI